MTTAAGACPACGGELVGGGDFSVWCPACDWNVDPDPPKPAGRFTGWWRRRQNALALNLAASVRSGQRIGRSGLGVRFAVWATSALVHLVTLALLVAAVLTLLASGPLVIRLIIAAFLLGMFLVVQPVRRRTAMPGGLVLDRDNAPRLFGLIDQVATSAKSKPVSRVLVSGRYNAAYLKDRRRRPTIEIGVPLWVVLSPQERVAMLGHEIGHRVNGDLRDQAFVAYAIDSLRNWLSLVRSPGMPAWRQRAMGRRIHQSTGQGAVAFAEMLLPIVLFPVTAVIGLLGTTLSLMAMRQGQRCEYRADEVAARVGGSDAAGGVVDKLLIADACRMELRQIIRFRGSQNPWLALPGFVESLPETEWERLRRRGRQRLHRIDITHPPTALRADYVQALPRTEPAVTVDSDLMRAINQELNSAAERVTATLRSNYA